MKFVFERYPAADWDGAFAFLVTRGIIQVCIWRWLFAVEFGGGK